MTSMGTVGIFYGFVVLWFPGCSLGRWAGCLRLLGFLGVLVVDSLLQFTVPVVVLQSLLQFIVPVVVLQSTALNLP